MLPLGQEDGQDGSEETTMKTDAKLQQDVIDELSWEPRVEAAHIGISARDGVVTLNGHVASYAQKAAAERAVRRVAGVRGIAMDLFVRLPEQSKKADDEIAARALRLLEWDMAVPHERILVQVEDGIVTLTGTVDWQFQKEEAELDIAKLSGVRGLVNGIVVTPPASPKEVDERIRAALHRHADVESESIRVTSLGGKVILEGAVDNWHDREAAVHAAWSAPGVASVEDRITLSRP
jgi:osmotically-inducible protein OsmY